MHALLDQLDTERRAFVQGTSFHIQSYETEDGTRFVRRPDGSYSNGSAAYPSLIDLLEGTLGPITPAQLYALVAIYHPLVTARISPDHQPHEMSRSQARSFIANQGASLDIGDVSIESGKLRIAALALRAAAPAAPPSPPPAPAPQMHEYKALLEVTYRTKSAFSVDELKAEIASAMPQLISAASGERMEARDILVAHVSGEGGDLEPA